MEYRVLQNYALIYSLIISYSRTCAVVVVVSDTVYTNNDIDSNHYYYYDKAGELENKEYKKVSDDDSGGGKRVSCTNKDDCMKQYTPGIEYALALNSSLIHEPYCDNAIWECTCGTYCLSRSKKKDGGKVFYYCGPCGRIGSYCGNNHTICSPDSVTACNDDDYCDCNDDGEFYDIYYCYVSYYGYEIALQLAISTCIAIALCLLVASIYNAIGFRRIRRMQDLRQILRSETGGVRESPPDDIPPKYDDVIADLPSYQDALKMNQNPSKRQRNGVINEGFEGEISASSFEDGTDERSQTYSNIPPTINRKKSNKADSKNSVNINAQRQSSHTEEERLVESSQEGETARVPKYVRKKASDKSESRKSSLNCYNGSENRQKLLVIQEDGTHSPIVHSSTPSQDSDVKTITEMNGDKDQTESVSITDEEQINVASSNIINTDDIKMDDTNI